jgi:hypothetical protein
MPSTSKKQHNFMAAIANNPAFAKKAGIPQSVGSDFVKADKGHKFSKGGDTMATKGVNPFAKFEKSGKDVEKKGMKEGSKKEEAFDKSQMGMKRGGGVKKMADGGFASMPAGSPQQIAAMRNAVGLPAGASQGSVANGMPTRAAPARSAPVPVRPAGRATAMMKKGGDVKKYAKGGSVDGVAQRGKTKGTMITMKKGGKC